MIFVVVLTLVASAHAAAQYSDNLARNFMLPLSSAAYSDNPQLCLSNRFPNSTLHRQVTVRCDSVKKDSCSGFSAVLHPQKAIVVSFRGTTNAVQLLKEVELSVFFRKSPWFLGGWTSRYFFDAFMAIWYGGMKDDLVDLTTKFPHYEIWITGHSLGGAIASLAASQVVGSGLGKSSNTKLITFGQPRTGNKVFAHVHNTMVEYSFRVTHWKDIVPHVPPTRKGGYFHHRNEVFYTERMKPDEIVICEDGEDVECSNGLWFTASINEHTHYFGRQVSEYGINGCVDAPSPAK